MPGSIVQTFDQFLVCRSLIAKVPGSERCTSNSSIFGAVREVAVMGGNLNLEVLRLHLRLEFTMPIGLSQDIPNHSDCAVKHLLFILVAHGFSSVAS